MDAYYEPGEWKGVKIGRGQLTVGRTAYAERCGISERQFRTCMERLKATNEITTKTTNKYTLVTICQYDLYQSNTFETTSTTTNEMANERPTNDQPTTTIKETKKLRNKKDTLSYSLSKELGLSVEQFIDMRKRIKKPLTQTALDLLLNKLNGMTNTEEGKIAIINESVMNSWQGIFPLKDIRITKGLEYERAAKEWVEKKDEPPKPTPWVESSERIEAMRYLKEQQEREREEYRNGKG